MFQVFAFSMSALSLHSSHFYSHLPDNIRTPEQAPAPAQPVSDPLAALVDQQHFGQNSARSLRAEEGVPSLASKTWKCLLHQNLEMSLAPKLGNVSSTKTWKCLQREAIDVK